MRVAKLDRSKFNIEQSDYMPKIPEIAKCPEQLLPLKQWEDAFLAEFSELRLVCSHPDYSSCSSSYRKISYSHGKHEIWLRRWSTLLVLVLLSTPDSCISLCLYFLPQWLSPLHGNLFPPSIPLKNSLFAAHDVSSFAIDTVGGN